MTIDYTIELFSFWHCGSGLDAGTNVDELALKDPDGLPFVPGRTVKGLLRSAAQTLQHMGVLDASHTDLVFGKGGDGEGYGQMGCASFTDAVLSHDERRAITANRLGAGLYRSVASTAIGDDGIAKDHTLRRIQVVVPCVLHGHILGVPVTEQECKEFEELHGHILGEPGGLARDLEACMGMVKRIGLGRSRGLGRCDIRREG